VTSGFFFSTDISDEYNLKAAQIKHIRNKIRRLMGEKEERSVRGPSMTRNEKLTRNHRQWSGDFSSSVSLLLSLTSGFLVSFIYWRYPCLKVDERSFSLNLERDDGRIEGMR